MVDAITPVLFAGLGGAARAVLGVLKNWRAEPGQYKFDWQYFGLSIAVAAILGLVLSVTGLMGSDDPGSLVMEGYGGTYIVLALYTILTTEKVNPKA
jgi:hypothetical protein